MTTLARKSFQTVEIRVRGRVQGVGFRPTIWRMAHELGPAGEVRNDAGGVLLRLGGERARIAAFLDGIKRALPPLARVDAIETRDYTGGEFLLADYLGFRRLARLRPVAMPGGAQAVRQPWRNLYALLLDAIGWAGLTARFSALDLHACLDGKPRALLDAMIAQQMNAPPRSAVLRRSICRAP